MSGRVLALAIGLMSGLAGAQLPEFAQQYRQRQLAIARLHNFDFGGDFCAHQGFDFRNAFGLDQVGFIQHDQVGG